MNNKQLGTQFERKVCEVLKNRGYWVHFLSPDSRGAQPFDIIAVRYGVADAIECKTLAPSKRYFSIDRLEDNQVSAFEYWVQKNGREPYVYVEHGRDVHVIGWYELKQRRRVDLSTREFLDEDFSEQ